MLLSISIMGRNYLGFHYEKQKARLQKIILDRGVLINNDIIVWQNGVRVLINFHVLAKLNDGDKCMFIILNYRVYWVYDNCKI